MVRFDRFDTRDASPELLHRIRSLCDAAFAGNFGDDDMAHSLGGTHVVASDADEVVAHASVVERRLWVGEIEVRAGYVEAVAVRPGRQRNRLGSHVMGLLHTTIVDRFDVGALSTGEHGFYRSLGWDRWRGPTFVVEGSRRRRTAEDDDGLMVLRFGRSADLDLTMPLTCEARAGDHW